MKKLEVLELYQGLMELPPLKGVKFSYAVAKNLFKLKPEVEAIQKGLESSEAFKKYDEAREDIAKKHAEKNSKGDPIIANNQYFIKDRTKFDEEIEELKKSHKEAVEEREEQIKQYGELLKEETDLVIYKVPLSEVPADIDTKAMAKVFNIIEENKPEVKA